MMRRETCLTVEDLALFSLSREWELSIRRQSFFSIILDDQRSLCTPGYVDLHGSLADRLVALSSRTGGVSCLTILTTSG